MGRRIHPNLWSSKLEMAVRMIAVSNTPGGDFINYIQAKKAAGADLAHLKPPHMNPHDSAMEVLVGEKWVKAPSPEKPSEVPEPEQIT